MTTNQAEEISSDEESPTLLHLETEKIDVIDLTTGYHTTELVDLTEDNTIPKRQRRRQRRRPGTRTNGQLKRPAAEINIELSDHESDEEELPQVLPDFPSGREKTKAPREHHSPAKVSVLCPICFDHYDKIVNTGRRLMSTKCGHVFCSECIRAALKSTKVCPTCRKKVTLNQLHPLYL